MLSRHVTFPQGQSEILVRRFICYQKSRLRNRWLGGFSFYLTLFQRIEYRLNKYSFSASYNLNYVNLINLQALVYQRSLSTRKISVCSFLYIRLKLAIYVHLRLVIEQIFHQHLHKLLYIVMPFISPIYTLYAKVF